MLKFDEIKILKNDEDASTCTNCLRINTIVYISVKCQGCDNDGLTISDIIWFFRSEKVVAA